MKCLAKDRNNNSCRNYYQPGSRFCKNHQYMNDYSDTMLEKTRLCSGCKKMYFMEPGINQCSTCHGRGTANREKLRTTSVIVLCGKPGCTYSKSADNAYCGLHQICLFEDECTNAGTRPCSKYLRGCRVQLSSDYLNRSCAECLEKERVRDHAARSAVVSDIIDGLKQCSVCCKLNPVDCYVGANGQDTKTCRLCRDEFNKQNEKRDKEHVRELDRKNSKKPERIAVKNEWNANNYEKVAFKTLNYRDRQHNENQEAYLEHNAETMRKWRENNLEKVVENNESRLMNIGYRYEDYKRTAVNRGHKFELDLAQFDAIVKMPCHYCGDIQEKGFNGIDRMDQQQGYVLTNCASCCRLCNFIKGAVDNISFLHRIEHILTKNSIIKGNLYPEAFANHNGSSYSLYKTNASKRGYVFEILEEEYYKIIQDDCYICGKKTDETHINGIDRFDNDVGYTLANANACCGECNYMKRDLEYNVLFDRFNKIYEHSLNKTQIEPSIYITDTRIPNKNKKSKEEIREASRVKKENQRQAMREKYGNEEYKKRRAEELAKLRKDKKNDK